MAYMEINAKIRATAKEMDDLFDFDDIVSVRHFKLYKKGVYSVILRVPDCDIIDIKEHMCISEIKEKIVKLYNKCGNKIISASVKFKNGTTKIVYGGSEYWIKCNANSYAKIYNTEVESIYM